MKKMNEVILSAKDLCKSYAHNGGQNHIISHMNLDLYEGETLAIVGESGSGKSVFTKSFLGMLDANGKITNGSIMYRGTDISKYKKEKQRSEKIKKPDFLKKRFTFADILNKIPHMNQRN